MFWNVVDETQQGKKEDRDMRLEMISPDMMPLLFRNAGPGKGNRRQKLP
jgi:hypothetical protein